MLFPLPLTAFENYMLADDRPEHPMCFFVRLSFWGSIDQSALEASMRQAVTRHPLLRSFVCKLNGVPHWMRAYLPPQIVWNESEDLEPPQAGYLNLYQELGLKVFVTHAEGQARVLFQFHHACTDGIGALRFIEDLLALYTSESAGASVRPNLMPLNPALLSNRGSHGLNVLGRILRLPVDALATWGILQFFCHRPSAIEPAQTIPNATAPSTSPSFVARRLTAERLSALRAAAHREGVTVNDLLIRDLLLAIDAWNARHNPDACGSCTRVSVPVNLRRPSDGAMPAANAVSMIFVDRRITEKCDPRRLLKSIRLDTFFVKKFRLAPVFTWVVELLGSVRSGFRWLLSGEEALSTAVLSNLGVQFDDLPVAYLGQRTIIGDALLDTVDFLPPIRQGTNVSIGVITYADELKISMQYNSKVISPLLADELLRLYEQQLTEPNERASTAEQSVGQVPVGTAQTEVLPSRPTAA